MLPSTFHRLWTLPSVLLAGIVMHASVAAVDVRVANTTTLAAPIAFAPDGSWHGIDGSWSTFTLRVGTPEQLVSTLVSFASYQTWVVLNLACNTAEDPSSCDSARGGTFNNASSSTWNDIGLFAFSIEHNLDGDDGEYEGAADYGYDTVGLEGVGDNGPTVKNTTVGAFATLNYYLGVFGLNPKRTNFTDYNDGSPSYMSLLKAQNEIASLSAGYTAGARYRYSSAGALASLTLGGYDSSRFVENDIDFPFAADNGRDLVVAIQDITTPSQIDNNPQPIKLLPNAVYAYIDSTVPQIWLPVEACLVFEAEFGLVYDNATELYLVNDTLHTELLQRNPNVTFHLAIGLDGGNNVQIELPYAAFDLTAQPPYLGLGNTTNYFPLRRADNASQYTLGRTFLQEAYLTVDWEAQRFNVSQATFNQSAQEQLVVIPPFTGASTSGSPSSSHKSSSSINGGTIAGIVVGVLAALGLIACAVMWYLHRRNKARKQRALHEKLAPEGAEPLTAPGRTATVFPKAELEGSSPAPHVYRGANRDSANTHLLSNGSTVPSSPRSAHASTVGYMGYNHSLSADNASHSPTTSSNDEGGTHSSMHSSTFFTPVSLAGVSHRGPASVAGLSNHSGPSHSGSEGLDHPIYEMAGDMPTIKEKDGRPLSEKEALQHRERVYNGVDVVPMSPTSTESHDEPPPVPARASRRLTWKNVVPVQSSSSGPSRSLLHRAFSFERK